MQWEYACLVRALVEDSTTKTSKWSYTFFGPGGSGSIEGDSSVEVLNQLGRDGWEALAVEPRYVLYGGNFSPGVAEYYQESLVERNIWFKRPINTGTSR
jgi:hypothetical protein